MGPLYRSVFEDVGGFLVSLKLKLYFKGNVILPPYTSRVTKYIIYSSDCFGKLRELYESRSKFRPVTLSTLHTLSGKPLYKRGSEEQLISVREGMTLTASITYFTREGSPLDYSLYDCSGTVREPFNNIEFSIWEIEVLRLESLSLGLDKGDIIRLDFKTPLVMSTKVMTPPSLKSLPLIKNTPNEYRLLPTPGYVAASAMRVWLGVVNGVDPDEYHAPYGIGRLADIFTPEIDYRIRPVTIVYGKDKSGRLRKVRGVVGHVSYLLRSRKIAVTLDRLFALAARMGLGKNRSIGFGELSITTYRP
ncbi:MAG: CRISPR system precrRNA processing endoribonuclease RAMP protein Cas6 [Desulfurococcales archaeon]|nr:CRISPR system precrRNA processing endoribonuclease RAMP protein Cas6 [Desulfurococcales archaeon]